MNVGATPRRLVVAISGASGSIYGIRLLEMLRDTDIETHLIMSEWGARTLVYETSYSVRQVQELARVRYAIGDESAAVASGSFLTMGMVVVPCSVRTLGAIANGVGDNLIHRAADVILKEGRKLALVVREAPLNAIHLENMLKLSRMGVAICPPSPAFYSHPQSIADIVEHTVVRVLDQVGIHLEGGRWEGDPKRSKTVQS